MSVAPSTRVVFFTLTFPLVLASVLGTSCKRRDESPTPQMGYGTSQPQSQGYPPPSYPPPAPRGSMPPAFGFVCATDNDLQCPFGHCIGGRCGGCQDPSQCKPGLSCIPSVMGMTCWPGNQALPPAPAPPPPSPTFAPQPQPPSPPSPPPTPGDPFSAGRQSCVDRLNAYRARVRVRPVARDTASEPCADEESRLDSASNRAHGSFGRCREMAQNACPNYPGASTEDIIASCFQQMFDEGPGGGHYDNMTNPKYTTAYCGFASVRDGRVWVIQNFR